MINITGYSERGVINSFFYELKYFNTDEKTRLNLLGEFISMINFPFVEQKNIRLKNISGAEIFIEQSFSDFGDADVLIFIDSGEDKYAFFIEAKVKTYSRNEWLLEDEYKAFLSLLQPGQQIISNKKYANSNLFTQLYFKQRLFNEIQRLSLLDNPYIEIPFRYFNKRIRKTGSNKVVEAAVKKIWEYRANGYFVCLIPNQNNSLDLLYPPFTDLEENNLLATYGKLEGLNTKKWGQITWNQIHRFCSIHNNIFEGTRNVFDWNKGQIDNLDAT